MTQTFRPMLAAKANPAKLQFPLFVQTKFDGIRCSVVDGQALTRTLKPIPNAEIAAYLANPAFNGLDGELIVGDPVASDCYRRTSSFVMSASKVGEPWIFYVFDKWDEPGGFEDRYRSLRTFLQRTFLHIQIAGNRLATDAAGLASLEEAAVAAGHEGVILRSPSAPYKFGRASATKGELLKLKRFVDGEAEVLGCYEEQANENEKTTNALGRSERSSKAAGKRGKGTLGGLYLRALDDALCAPGTEFKCGTGFDAFERAELWAMYLADPLTIVGRTAKIKSFLVGAKDKPRFPTFLGWREIGDV